MTDPRVALRFDDLWEASTKEMKWLAAGRPSTWDIVGNACGVGGSPLASMCIAAGHVSYHFLHRRVLHPASEMPWSLVRGAALENLQALADGDCPTEPVSAQLWQLMHMGHNRAQLLGVVRLLGEVPWSSLPAEQQHGSLAQVRRWHPEYGAETLLSRALLMQVCRLMPGPSKEERRIAVICRRLDRLEAANPGKATGRHEFLKGLIAAFARKKSAGDERLRDRSMRGVAKMYFARHVVLWAQQSVRVIAAFNRRASVSAVAKAVAGCSSGRSVFPPPPANGPSHLLVCALR